MYLQERISVASVVVIVIWPAYQVLPASPWLSYRSYCEDVAVRFACLLHHSNTSSSPKDVLAVLESTL